MIRNGKKYSKNSNTNAKIAHLQELAIVLNKNTFDEKKEESKALEEVDELSRKFKPGNNPDPLNKPCCACDII